MIRRVIGAAIGLAIVAALGLVPDDQNKTQPYASVGSLGGAIKAHGIGCSRIYPARFQFWPDDDAATCEVGSAAVTLHTWKNASSPPTYLGEPSRHVSWVVGPNWLVAATNRFAAVQVAMVIGGDLIPEEIPMP